MNLISRGRGGCVLAACAYPPLVGGSCGARANPKRKRGRAKKTEVLTSTGSPNQKSRIQIQGDLQWGGRASLAVAVGTKGAASSDSRIAVVTLSIVWMATVASVSPALQRLRSEVQAANAPRINGDAMVRCCRIAIGFFKVVVEIPYWRGGSCCQTVIGPNV